MTESQDRTATTQWEALLELPDEERIERMVETYQALAGMGQSERRSALEEQIGVVYRMDDANLRAMTESRLRAWLRMDPETAKPVAEEFEAVLDDMPAEIAMRRVTVVQLVSMRLSPEEREQLRALVPRVMGNEPHQMGSQPAASDQEPRRPWWAFWRKS